MKTISVFKVPYERLAEIPQTEYKNLFKQYWTFIAENHLTHKPVIIGESGLTLSYVDCFACEYVREFRDFRRFGEFCQSCPLQKYYGKRLFNGRAPCAVQNEPLYKWDYSKSQDEKDKLALEIANLEWED